MQQSPSRYWPAAFLFGACHSRRRRRAARAWLESPARLPGDGIRRSEMANDIYTMTVDPKGRIVVAAKGYIRILEDTTGKGNADKAILFADTPKDGAMGLLWEGDALYVTGDGGLRKFSVASDGNHAAGPRNCSAR